MPTGKRRIEIMDLSRFVYIADPNISPNGQQVAWVATTVDYDKNRYQSALWLAATDGTSAPYKFTSGSAKDTSPRWSPDGSHLAFLSNRSGKNQIWVMPADGGEAWQATDVANGVGEIGWVPGSRALYFTSKVDPEAVSDARTSDTKVITNLIYKMDGEGYLDGKNRHVFTVDREGGEPVQLTTGEFNCSQPAFSADGRYLACVDYRAEDRGDISKTDVWVHDLREHTTHCVTPSDGNYMLPAWSPTGQLAYIGHPVLKPWGPSTLDTIYVWDPAKDESTPLLDGLDREPGNSGSSDARYGTPAQSPVWANDGKSIYTLISDRGSVHIYSVPLKGKAKALLDGERDIQSFTVADNGAFAFASSTHHELTEVWVRGPRGAERRISSHNDTLLDGIELGEVEEITFSSDPGVELHGWLMKPPGFDPNVKYPAVVEIHGGPHAMYGVGFFHELQLLAANGYVVAFTNPRGSTGYGQEFVTASMNDWGGADYRDVMAILPHLEKQGYVDMQRLGVLGGSYGGYMTNWIIGQSDAFKAAVTMRSTCNRFSQYGTSDFTNQYNDWEFGGSPYENHAFYMERSPITYVDKVNTPVLILHSENDLRCPITQGEEFFVALKKHGKEVEFVRFPDESHGLSRGGQPVHRVERLERIVNWLNSHI